MIEELVYYLISVLTLNAELVHMGIIEIFPVVIYSAFTLVILRTAFTLFGNLIALREPSLKPKYVPVLICPTSKSTAVNYYKKQNLIGRLD